MTRHASILFTSVVVLAGAFLLGGCGSGHDIGADNGSDLGIPGYPAYKNLTQILQVVDPAGQPIGGATVTVDGEKDDELTVAQFYPLGDAYPSEWRGWPANWTSDQYRIQINFPGATVKYEIRVHKDGWTEASTFVSINESEPDDIYLRSQLVLYPITDYRPQAVRQPAQAEVRPADPGFVRPQGHQPTKTIIGVQEGKPKN